MAANPPLLQTPQGVFPGPYAGEWVGLCRPGVEIRLEGLPRGPARWDRRGVLFLTNLRMTFIADSVDERTGLQAYDLPLAHIRQQAFHQPILGCNNLTGLCQIVDEAASGPLKWTVYFKTGGVGTFLPLFYAYLRAYSQGSGAQPAVVATEPVPAPAPPPEPKGSSCSAEGVAEEPSAPPAFLQTAFVDPSDPTRVFLTQPAEAEERAKPSAPPQYTLL